MVSTALIRSTFLTVWHVFLPRSSRVCSVGSWGRPRRRSVPSCPQGGRSGPVPLPGQAERIGSAAPAPAQPSRARPARSLRGAWPALSQTGSEPPPARVTSPATPPRGHESTDGLYSGPCRIVVPARLGADRSSGRSGYIAADPRASAAGSCGRWCTAGRCVVVHRDAIRPYGLGRRSQTVALTVEIHPS